MTLEEKVDLILENQARISDVLSELLMLLALVQSLSVQTKLLCTLK